jgi:exopolysaccharide biosynthesis predicted pyruvyltransferase EpsI
VLGLSNVTFFAREQNSFSKAKGLGRVSLGIDLALFSQYFDEMDSNESTSIQGVLVCLRTDAASQLTNGAYSLNSQINNDISITKSDLDGWLQAIKDSDSIVTDRLHVAVAAVMLNKKLCYIDADVNKIGNYFKFTFGSVTPTDKVVKVDLTWLYERGYIELKEVS